MEALEQFATNEAIQITEIFEYVQKLSDPNATPILHSFLYYKFLYAIRLLDFGFCDSALHYLEELAQVILFLLNRKTKKPEIWILQSLTIRTIVFELIYYTNGHPRA